MKKWIVVMAAAMVSLSLVSPAMAKGKKNKGGASSKSGKHESGFAKRDANHDGEITFEEFKAFHDAKMAAKKAAKKADGKKHKAGKAGKGKKAGKSGKGKKQHITLQERFDRRDSNHDGKITKQEWKATKAKKSGKTHKKNKNK